MSHFDGARFIRLSLCGLCFGVRSKNSASAQTPKSPGFLYGFQGFTLNSRGVKFTWNFTFLPVEEKLMFGSPPGKVFVVVSGRPFPRPNRATFLMAFPVSLSISA